MTNNFNQEEYDQEKMCNAMDSYLLQCVDEWKQLQKSYSEKWESYQNVLQTKVPTVPGFILYVLNNKIRKKLSKDTLYRRSRDEKKYPWWKDKMDLLMLNQQERVLQGMAWNTYNPLFGKLLLSQHGIHEKTIVESQDGGDSENKQALDDLEKLTNWDED